jgi:hypothetical protein
MSRLIQYAASPPADSRFPRVDPAQAQGGGIEIILIVVAGILTLALLAFFIYVFSRKGE